MRGGDPAGGTTRDLPVAVRTSGGGKMSLTVTDRGRRTCEDAQT